LTDNSDDDKGKGDKKKKKDAKQAVPPKMTKE
jgi:hypothetical protein